MHLQTTTSSEIDVYKDIFEQPLQRIPLDEPHSTNHAPSKERIDALFKKMPAQKRLYLQVIDYCKNMQSAESVDSLINKLQKDKKSVYGSSTLCLLLEREGALTRIVNHDTPPQKTDDAGTPDELQLLSADEPAVVYWLATEAGLSVLSEHKEADPLRVLFDEDRHFLSLYEYILSHCEGEGESTQQLREAIDDHPLAQQHHLFTTHFLNKLEKCLALEWSGTWKTTDYGKAGLSFLRNQAEEQSEGAGQKKEQR